MKKTIAVSMLGIFGFLCLNLVGVQFAEASGIFIPPRPPAIKKPGAAKCEPADSEKCKAEEKK